MKLNFSYLKKYWEEIFCYLLIVIGVLFTLVIIGFQPMKVNTAYLYKYSNKDVLEELSFPVVQHIQFQQDHLNSLNIILKDLSINDYTYRVKLLDQKNQEYYNQQFKDYEGNVISIPLEQLNLLKNHDYLLKIECEECSGVKFSVKDLENDSVYLENVNHKSLEMTTLYLSKNNGYYWYSAMAIVIGLTLLPVARGRKNGGK